MNTNLRQAAEDQLAGIRDRVLAGARLGAGDHVVDLGAGTGLLALAVLDAVGPTGAVSAVDLSADSLRLIRPDVGGTLRRVAGDVTALPLPDGCADAVVARSVLIYVADLPAAIGEAARVLRPGGRLSVFEPVNSRRTHDAELTGVTSAELTQIHDALAEATPTARTLTAFDEQHAAALAVEAGFTGITITTDVARNRLTDVAAVEATLTRPGHPGAPTPLDTVALALGTGVARRYADAWRHAIRTRGTITYSTPSSTSPRHARTDDHVPDDDASADAAVPRFQLMPFGHHHPAPGGTPPPESPGIVVFQAAASSGRPWPQIWADLVRSGWCRRRRTVRRR